VVGCSHLAQDARERILVPRVSKIGGDVCIFGSGCYNVKIKQDHHFVGGHDWSLDLMQDCAQDWQ
jgi:hypothetical protein